MSDFEMYSNSEKLLLFFSFLFLFFIHFNQLCFGDSTANAEGDNGSQVIMDCDGLECCIDFI